MPSNSQVNRALGRGRRKGLTHREVMQKRHEKRRKKEKRDLKQKKMDLLKEYKRLCSLEGGQSKKTLAMSLMEAVEEIKEEGMNDNRYLQIMDMLMCLHKSDEESAQTETRSLRTMRDIHQMYFDNRAQNTDFYYDRIGDEYQIIGDENQNIINELNANIIETDNLIRDRSNIIIDNTVMNGWERIGQGTWRRTDRPDTEDNQRIITPSGGDDY